MNIFVTNLSDAVNKEILRSLFETHGRVKSAKIIMDRETGKSRGFGFIEMPNDHEAKTSIEKLNHHFLEGKHIKVLEAIPR